MKAIELQDASSSQPNFSELDLAKQDARAQIPGSMADLHFDLALWARSLESFCSIGRHAFPNEPLNSGERNYRNEFYITHLVLLRCAELIEELLRNAEPLNNEPHEKVQNFRRTILPLIACGSAFTRLRIVNFAEWNAWSEIVAQHISSSELYKEFDPEFEEVGRSYLPEPFVRFLASEELNEVDRGDIENCLPVLGGILRSLDVVKQMLTSDLPLKSALAIFAFVYETTQELTFHMNERLSHREDETSEIFAMLDAATYTLTIESKKVFNHELSAVIDTRSATAVFARVEAATGLLNDNIRHLLSGFLRLAEPEVLTVDLFPEFKEKLERSIVLRNDLWSILNAVRKAEENPGHETGALRTQLAAFLQSSFTFLFYKDRETFERFCNEIIATADGQDSHAILHSFSAYVETLFNQVGMRAVLLNHPFTPDD